MGLFSKELQILDKNTVQYMIDQMQDTIDEQQSTIQEQQNTIYRKKFRRDETAQAGLCPPFLSKVRYRTSYGASAGIRFHPT